MTKATIEFFWDVGSPYTYLAATQLAGLGERTGADIVWRPFLLGGVFKATGNNMPAALPVKGKYMLDDLRRWAARYAVPFDFPARLFPLNTLLPMRVATAIEPGDKAAEVGLAMMRAYWAEGQNVSRPEVLAPLLSGCGLDGQALLGQAGEQSTKDKLRANTDEAVKRGAFGAPTFFIGEQMFWGNDRLVLVEEAARTACDAP